MLVHLHKERCTVPRRNFDAFINRRQPTGKAYIDHGTVNGGHDPLMFSGFHVVVSLPPASVKPCARLGNYGCLDPHSSDKVRTVKIHATRPTLLRLVPPGPQPLYRPIPVLRAIRIDHYVQGLQDRWQRERKHRSFADLRMYVELSVKQPDEPSHNT